MILGTIEQQPHEMLDYQVDFNNFFAGDDDYITSVELFISDYINVFVSSFYDGLDTVAPYVTVPFIPPPESIQLTVDDGYGDIEIEGDLQPRYVRFFLMGGNDGDRFKITVRIHTRLRRVKEEEIKVKIKER